MSHSYFQLHFVIFRGRLKEKYSVRREKSSVVRTLRRNERKEKCSQIDSALILCTHSNFSRGFVVCIETVFNSFGGK